MIHSGDLENDVREARQLMATALQKGTDATYQRVCCYDGAKGISKGDLNIPGGGQFLFRENILNVFMLVMKSRGIDSGTFYIHLKCLFMYTLHDCTDAESQQNAANEFEQAVDIFNSQFGVNWQVIVEKGGSAPI